MKPSNITDKIIPLSFAKKPFDTPCKKRRMVVTNFSSLGMMT